MDLKSTLYQKLSEQDKQNIKELTNKYKTSDYTLAEIFNVKSEIYKNIPLSQLCLSARVVSAIIVNTFLHQKNKTGITANITVIPIYI